MSEFEAFKPEFEKIKKFVNNEALFSDENAENEKYQKEVREKVGILNELYAKIYEVTERAEPEIKKEGLALLNAIANYKKILKDRFNIIENNQDFAGWIEVNTVGKTIAWLKLPIVDPKDLGNIKDDIKINYMMIGNHPYTVTIKKEEIEELSKENVSLIIIFGGKRDFGEFSHNENVKVLKVPGIAENSGVTLEADREKQILWEDKNLLEDENDSNENDMFDIKNLPNMEDLQLGLINIDPQAEEFINEHSNLGVYDPQGKEISFKTPVIVGGELVPADYNLFNIKERYKDKGYVNNFCIGSNGDKIMVYVTYFDEEGLKNDTISVEVAPEFIASNTDEVVSGNGLPFNDVE